MALEHSKFNCFLCGLIPGLLLPAAFIWIYLQQFYPVDLPVIEIVKKIYPQPILGKLLILSIMPDLILVFAFYKTDSFKLATGFMIGAMPYLLTSMMIL